MPAAVRDLLHEVAGVLRRARAAMRRVSERAAEPVGKPAPANAEPRAAELLAPSLKRVAPASSPRPAASSASADRTAPATPLARPDGPTPAGSVTPTRSTPTTGQRPAAGTPARPSSVSVTPQRQGLGPLLAAVVTRARSRWLPLHVAALLTLVVVLLGDLGGTAGAALFWVGNGVLHAVPYDPGSDEYWPD